MSDPLTLVGVALGIAATALQLLSKRSTTMPVKQERELRENVGKELAEMELRLTKCFKEEIKEMEEHIRERVHSLANKITTHGLGIENNTSEIKSLWRENDRRKNPRD